MYPFISNKFNSKEASIWIGLIYLPDIFVSLPKCSKGFLLFSVSEPRQL